MNVQETPNPLSLKFVIPQGVTEGQYMSFFTPEEVKHVAVLKEILELPGVAHIFLAPDFLTVTRSEDTPWSLLQSIILCILKHYESSFPLIGLVSAVQKEVPVIDYSQDEEAIIQEIQALIATRVRPNVEADGGTIEFDHLKDGVVYVKLAGACSGCPHSSQTLTYGIENLLKHYIPEVQRVEALMHDMVEMD